MKTNSKSEAIILCEKALENIFAENAEMNILPKTNDIITRMLKHQLCSGLIQQDTFLREY